MPNVTPVDRAYAKYAMKLGLRDLHRRQLADAEQELTHAADALFAALAEKAASK